MIRQRERLYRSIFLAADVAIALLAYLGATQIRGALAPLGLPPNAPLSDFLLLLPAVAAIWASLCFVFETHDFRLPLRAVALRHGKVSLAGALSLVALVFLARLEFMPRSFVLILIAADWGLQVALRPVLLRFARLVMRRGADSHRVLIVGTGPDAREVAAAIARDKSFGLRVVGFVDEGSATAPGAGVLGRVEEIERLMVDHFIDVVVFSAEKPIERFASAIAAAELLGVRVSIGLFTLRGIGPRTSFEILDGIPMLTFARTPTDEVALVLKRAFDIVIASLALVLTAPLLLLAAIAVRLESGGPILYSQVRVGRMGRRFMLHKFRSMIPEAEEMKHALARKNEADGPMFKIKDDPRVTRVGRWIRRTSIDELPQLWNVLRGEMSLVGPRPSLPEEVDKLEPWQRRRLSMKPGLTCIWQVSGRNRVGFEDWMRLDLEYIDAWSLWLDLKILAKTVPVVLLGTGAS